MDDAYMVYSGQGESRSTDGQKRCVERYHVENCSMSDNPFLATGIPAMGEVYDEGWVVSEQSYELHPELQTTAIVTVEYVRDPMSLPCEVSFYSSHKEVASWREAATDDNPDGKVILNSCGDPYAPPLSHDKALCRLEVLCRKTNSDVDQDWVLNYVDHINKNQFTISYTDGDGTEITLGPFDARTVKFADFRAPEVRDPYYHKQVLFVFEIDPDEWVKKVPDVGPRCFAPGTSPWQLIRQPPMANGKMYNGLALLDGSGFQVTDDAQNSSNPDDWYKENTFHDLPEADFEDLGLNTLMDWKTYYENELRKIMNDDNEEDGDPSLPPPDPPPSP